MSRRQIRWLVGAILAVIAFGALVLWWPPGAPASSSNLLGAALLGTTIVALAVLVAENLVSKQMREIENRNSLAAQERGLRREEAEEARQRQRDERIDKCALQLMAGFQQDLKMIDLSGRDMSGLYLRACNPPKSQPEGDEPRWGEPQRGVLGLGLPWRSEPKGRRSRGCRPRRRGSRGGRPFGSEPLRNEPDAGGANRGEASGSEVRPPHGMARRVRAPR